MAKKELRQVDRLRGKGSLAAVNLPPTDVAYDIDVRQWILDASTFGSMSEAKGSYRIEADIVVPLAARAAILQVCNDSGHAVLTLSDGRRAEIAELTFGDLLGSNPTGSVHCAVHELDGYTRSGERT